MNSGIVKMLPSLHSVGLRYTTLDLPLLSERFKIGVTLYKREPAEGTAHNNILDYVLGFPRAWE
jgi:hypothetical protein